MDRNAHWITRGILVVCFGSLTIWSAWLTPRVSELSASVRSANERTYDALVKAQSVQMQLELRR